MLDFPNSPALQQIFTAPNGTAWVWDGSKWISGAVGTGFVPITGGTMTGPLIQAADPVQPLGTATKEYVDNQNIRYRNRIINGDMSVDQRNGGNLVAMTSGYACDRWKCGNTLATSYGNIGQRPLSSPPVGLSALYDLAFVTTTAYTPAAADQTNFFQGVEGINFNDAQWGTANAQPVTLEFWFTTSVAGTYAGGLRNGATNRSYVFTFAATANVWQKFRINIPGDTAGTWAALYVTFNIGSGANFQAAAGAWTAGNFYNAPGAVNIIANSGANWNITNVALMVGAAAVNAEPEFKKFSDNLLDCQRYYQSAVNCIWSGSITSALVYYYYVQFMVMLRAAPTTLTLTDEGDNGFPTTAPGTQGITSKGFQAYKSANSTGNGYFGFGYTADADF